MRILKARRRHYHLNAEEPVVLSIGEKEGFTIAA